MAELQVCFGGRVAEELFCEDISSGAQSDIKMATALAKDMVQTWGMSESLGPIDYSGQSNSDGYFGPQGPEISQKTSELIDREIKKILDEAYVKAKELRQYNSDAHNQGGVWGCIPIVVLDVYEHAYFIDYGSDRKSYIADFWKNFDWETAEEIYIKSSKLEL